MSVRQNSPVGLRAHITEASSSMFLDDGKGCGCLYEATSNVSFSHFELSRDRGLLEVVRERSI